MPKADLEYMYETNVTACIYPISFYSPPPPPPSHQISLYAPSTLLRTLTEPVYSQGLADIDRRRYLKGNIQMFGAMVANQFSQCWSDCKVFSAS